MKTRWSTRCWKRERERELIIADWVANAMLKNGSHPVCEDPNGLDSPRNVDIFHADISGESWTQLEWDARRRNSIEGADAWEIVTRSSRELGVCIVKRMLGGHQKTGDELNRHYRSRYVAKRVQRGPKRSSLAEFSQCHRSVFGNFCHRWRFETFVGFRVHREISWWC